MTASRTAAATPQRTTPNAPRVAGEASDAALLAELALTFDLEALVAEAQADPFRR
ncbi:MAG TPA: hypothetical protein VMU87_09625 [Stellaceae bacterium]|nr:hypothetical protein [Stellaceae bacterium]